MASKFQTFTFSLFLFSIKLQGSADCPFFNEFQKSRIPWERFQSGNIENRYYIDGNSRLWLQSLSVKDQYDSNDLLQFAYSKKRIYLSASQWQGYDAIDLNSSYQVCVYYIKRNITSDQYIAEIALFAPLNDRRESQELEKKEQDSKQDRKQNRRKNLNLSLKEQDTIEDLKYDLYRHLKQQSRTTQEKQEKLNAERAKECAVCLEEMENNIYTAKCRHIFHVKCIGVWVKRCTDQGGEPTCPMCKQILNYSASDS